MKPQKDIYVRPSEVAMWMMCPRKLRYYRAMIQTLVSANALIFGTCYHRVVELFLQGVVKESEVTDLFSILWQQACKTRSIEFAKTKQADVLERHGRALVSAFVDRWNVLPLKPVIIEGSFAYKLADHRFMQMTMDLVAEATEDFDYCGLPVKKGDIGIIDHKSAIEPEPLGFASISFQLSYYMEAGIQHFDSFGIPKPSFCGYLTGVKPKSQGGLPYISELHLYERTVEHRKEALAVALRCADDIAADYLPRHPGMAFNTPCDNMMTPCDFVDHCLYGDTSLLKPMSYDQLLAVA